MSSLDRNLVSSFFSFFWSCKKQTKQKKKEFSQTNYENWNCNYCKFNPHNSQDAIWSNFIHSENFECIEMISYCAISYFEETRRRSYCLLQSRLSLQTWQPWKKIERETERERERQRVLRAMLFQVKNRN